MGKPFASHLQFRSLSKYSESDVKWRRVERSPFNDKCLIIHKYLNVFMIKRSYILRETIYFYYTIIVNIFKLYSTSYYYKCESLRCMDIYYAVFCILFFLFSSLYMTKLIVTNLVYKQPNHFCFGSNRVIGF